MTASSLPSVIQNSSARSKRHHSASRPGVTPNSSASETFYCKHSTQFNRKNCNNVKVKYTEDENASAFTSTSKQKENQKRKV